MIVVDVNDELGNHMVRALSEHARWCRANGLRMPPELSQLLAQLARNGQQRPGAVFVDEVGDDDSVLLLGYSATAARLGVSERTVRRLVADGRLPAVNIAGRRLIRASDLEQYVGRLEVA